MESYVRINVAKADRHMSVTGSGKLISRYTYFFHTEVKCVDPKRALAVFSALNERFPAPQWSVTADFWDCKGGDVTQILLDADT